MISQSAHLSTSRSLNWPEITLVSIESQFPCQIPCFRAPELLDARVTEHLLRLGPFVGERKVPLAETLAQETQNVLLSMVVSGHAR